MQYILTKFSNMFSRDQFHDESKTGTYIYKRENDKLYKYIVEKSADGPKGTYIYSYPKQNVYFKKLKQ